MTEKTNGPGEAEMALYWGDLGGSYVNGVQLDLRARLACDFIKAGLLTNIGPKIVDQSFGSDSAERLAVFVLDLATAIVDESQKRGLSKPMPDHSELSQGARLNIERQIRAQIYGQTAGQRIAREEMGPGIMPAGPGLLPV